VVKLIFTNKKEGRTDLGSTPLNVPKNNLISGFAMIHCAKCLIIDKLGDGGMVSTNRAIGITAHLKGVEACAQGIIHQQPANE
jgi:hypothetical protein